MLRIAWAGLVAVVLLAAGCGGAAERHGPAVRGMPRELARTWAQQASAIADAAAAGDSCRAHSLATSLRDEVIHAGGAVPLRLRTPLLNGVNSLAERTVCTPPPPDTTTAPTKKQPPHHHHDDHKHHEHHGHGGGKGDKGDNG